MGVTYGTVMVVDCVGTMTVTVAVPAPGGAVSMMVRTELMDHGTVVVTVTDGVLETG